MLSESQPSGSAEGDSLPGLSSWLVDNGPCVGLIVSYVSSHCLHSTQGSRSESFPFIQTAAMLDEGSF